MRVLGTLFIALLLPICNMLITPITENSINEALFNIGHSPLVIMFTSPIDRKSIPYLRDFKEISEQFKLNIAFSIVDVNKHADIAERFEVTSTPTLVAIKNMNTIYYKGNYSRNNLESWVADMSLKMYVEISTEEEFKRVLALPALAYIMVLNKSGGHGGNYLRDNYKFNYVLLQVDEIPSYLNISMLPAYITSINCEKQYQVSYEPLQYDALLRREEDGCFPLMLPFSTTNIRKHFHKVSQLVPIYSKKVYGKPFFDIYEIAKKRVDNFQFILCNGVADGEIFINGILGENNHEDTAFILRDRGRYVYKFPFTQITNDTMDEFINQYLQESIPKYFKSEPEPANNNLPVKIIVGSTFSSIVLDSTKDVLLAFIAPDDRCPNCQKQIDILNNIASKISAENPSLVIAKIDWSKNGADNQSLGRLPALKLFTMANKSGITYNGEPDELEILKFVKSNIPTAIINLGIKEDL